MSCPRLIQRSDEQRSYQLAMLKQARAIVAGQVMPAPTLSAEQRESLALKRKLDLFQAIQNKRAA